MRASYYPSTIRLLSKYYPALPNTLEVLNCSNNELATLPDLPAFLKTLDLNGNQLTNLPVLPSSIKIIDCSTNQLTNISALSFDSLSTFICSSNQLTALPTLPSSLIALECSANQLTTLPSLPHTLKSLVCGFNQLTILLKLPDSLQNLQCESNLLHDLPGFPDKLKKLNCENNQIICFPSFPTSLTEIKIKMGNAFSCLPNYCKAMDVATKKYPLCSIHNSNKCSVSKDAVTTIEIPSIFTPNGDDMNDTFVIKGTNLSNFTCRIYNRLGVLIYQWNDINIGWNGKDKNGSRYEDGTYRYLVSYTDNTGKAINKRRI
jgi:gliding motility-associated-like protein